MKPPNRWKKGQKQPAKKYKGISIRNADIAADISRVCVIPIDVAKEILKTTLKVLVKKIRKKKILKVPGFGRFSLFKKKRVRIPSGFVDATAFECRFVVDISLRRVLYKGLDWEWSYPRMLRKSILRLVKEGNIKLAIVKWYRLMKQFELRPGQKVFLAAHGGIPVKPHKKYSKMLLPMK